MKGPCGPDISHGSGGFSEIFRNMLGFLATSILRRREEISMKGI